ncbi:hypothetical protein FH5_04136 [Priestia endophytica]|nr:hypothetical protein FH5_04136 [Priestia endophytica]
MNLPLSLIFEKAQENLPGLLLYFPLSFLYRGIRTNIIYIYITVGLLISF